MTRLEPDGTRVSVESGHPVEWVSEDNYMFRLSAFSDPLRRWLARSEAVSPKGRSNEVAAWLDGSGSGGSGAGLTDLSVSRPRARGPWGIAVPEDPEHVVYVWLDALANYLTAAGGWRAVEAAERAGPAVPDCAATADGAAGAGVWRLAEGEAPGAAWPASEAPSSSSSQPLPQSDAAPWPPAAHIVGKDITRFHAVYWPAMLLAAGLALPQRVVAHGHWTVAGVKMSKSLGNVVDPRELLDGGPHAAPPRAGWPRLPADSIR